ncbi:hypothetical protein JRQ81_000998, partial [Phrynocephalus forsythii]
MMTLSVNPQLGLADHALGLWKHPGSGPFADIPVTSHVLAVKLGRCHSKEKKQRIKQPGQGVAKEQQRQKPATTLLIRLAVILLLCGGCENIIYRRRRLPFLHATARPASDALQRPTKWLLLVTTLRRYTVHLRSAERLRNLCCRNRGTFIK